MEGPALTAGGRQGQRSPSHPHHHPCFSGNEGISGLRGNPARTDSVPGSSLAESRVHARPPGHAPAEHALSGHLGSASIPEPGLSYVLGVEEKRQAPCWLMA